MFGQSAFKMVFNSFSEYHLLDSLLQERKKKLRSLIKQVIFREGIKNHFEDVWPERLWVGDNRGFWHKQHLIWNKYCCSQSIWTEYSFWSSSQASIWNSQHNLWTTCCFGWG